jgi:hypothetical protein
MIMQRLYQVAARTPAPELFFKAWVATAVALAAYITTVSAMVSDISTALWMIGAPIAFAKAALVVSGLGFLVWFVALRRT